MSDLSKYLWDKANLELYRDVLCNALSHLNLPIDALLCKEHDCHRHNAQLEMYYTDIVKCPQAVAAECVPSVKPGLQKFWWTPELDELKEQCIDISTLWASIGRPRSGSINEERLRCKYRYKQAIKMAMQDNDRQFNDSLYDKLCKKDEVSFWKAWRKRFCANRLKPTNMLNGKTGAHNVLSEFTEYYKGIVQPHNAAIDVALAQEVEQLMMASSTGKENGNSYVTVGEVEKCIGNLKRHKAAYLDNISSEHLIYGGPQLTVHMTLLFNSMIHHCFVPNDFCNGVILPLLKNKHGDASDVNMYRGITLSPVISKLFESVLLCLYDEYLTSDSLQFGFKKNSSCIHALFTVKESVRYFTKRGSNVYCTFLDASKAFDKVLHNGIFKKLLDRKAPVAFVRLLQYWYGNLQCRVKWNNAVGETFAVLCGVRQGGVLSPMLFSLYVNDLIPELKRSGYGIHVGSLFIGCVLYADDIVLLSASCNWVFTRSDRRTDRSVRLVCPTGRMKRLHVPIVGPTGRSDPGYVQLSVRPVGQTGQTDCSRTTLICQSHQCGLLADYNTAYAAA